MYNRTGKQKILFVIVAVIILLNSSYAYNTVDDSAANVLLGISTLALLLWSLRRDKKVNIGQFIALILVVGLGLSMIANQEVSQVSVYARQISVIIFALIFVEYFSITSFCEYYLQALDLVCLSSLAYCFFYNAIGGFQILEYTNKNGVTFASLIFVVLQKHNPFRICGPFWEAGILAGFIVIGMVYNIYVFNKRRKFRILLYIVSLVMTQSTAGYFLGVLALLMWYISASPSKSSFLKKLLVYVVIMLCVIFATPLIGAAASFLPEVFGKMTFKSVSMSTRVMNPIVDLQLWKKAPLFGLGIRQYNLLWNDVASSYLVGSRTSTITYFIATSGVLGLAYAVLILRGGMHQKHISLTERVILICIMLAIVTNEPQNLNVLMFLVIMFFNGDVMEKHQATAMRRCSDYK